MLDEHREAKLIEFESRKRDATFRRRKAFDSVYSYLRSCAVCTSFLPPIDLLCPRCWRELSNLSNRGPKLLQGDYPFPVFSLLTWTPETDSFVKPFIYGFKGGRAVRAAEKLATLFLSERTLTELSPSQKRSFSESLVTAAPAASFDHSLLWAQAVSSVSSHQVASPYRDVSPRKDSQKRLKQTERAERRFEVRELFAGSFGAAELPNKDPEQPSRLPKSTKRFIFADDVITSGSTAMAAYMALGDPDEFEVWTLAARPRLAGKTGVCYSPATP